MTLAVDARIVERYRRLRALESSPNPHEAARAHTLAERMAQAHGLNDVALRAHVPPGAQELPWWGTMLLDVIGAHLADEGVVAPPTWEERDGDTWLVVTGPRLAVDRARMLWAGARAAIALEASVACADGDAGTVFGLAAAAAFARSLKELRAWRSVESALVVWRPPTAAPSPPAAAPWHLRRLFLIHNAAAQRGARAGSLLGSRLELNVIRVLDSKARS